MSKQFYFFKKAARNRLEDNTFWTLWELVESWTQNDWLAIFFIIFLGIIFEIILIKICTSFNKKPALTEKGSSSAQEKENNCLKSVKFDNWPIPSSSEERVDDFSERTIASSLTSEENESNFEDRVLLADEVIWLSTSESKYQVSHFSESHITSSNGTSSSLSLFHSEVKEFFPSHGGYPENEHETIQFSSKKLFSTLKTNKNKNLIFSSDFNFSRNSRRSIESEDLNVAPCPPAHLFLSRDQVRILEENVRNQVALKSKTTSKSKTTYLCSRFQESPIQNQHSVTMDISAQAQDSLPGQNAIQNQGFYEARFTSQVQQFVNNQESVNSQPDIMVFALPRDLTRKPFCSSTQESFQTQEKDRSQHLVNVSYSVETQDSIKGLESDKNQFDEAQYSFCFEDSNKSKHLIEGQNAIFKNSRCLVLTVSPNALAEGMLQIESVKPEGQKQITSSELNQYFTYGSGPLSRTLFKRQKNRRKTLHSKSKFSLIVLSQKSKKTQVPLVFQITVCHTSKPSKLGCKYNAKKELHQRKSIPDTALHLTYVSKPVPPYIKKYSRKELVKVMPGVTGCRHSLSLDAENVNDAGSTEKRRTSGRTGDIKQHGRENEGQKTISPKTSPQLEQSFNNIFQLKSPCFSLIEMNWKNKESLKGPITQAKGIGIAEFHAPNSKKTSDLHIPKQEAPLEDIISEPWQKFVSSPKVESNRRMKIQEDLRSTENSHLPLLGGKKLPTSSPETRRYFPDGSTQKQEDFLEIVLETSEVNLFISLGIKEYKDSEQLASIKTQKSTEDVIMKEKKPPVTLHATEGDNPSDSEGLEYNSRSNVKNMQGERIFATFLDATNTNVSEPLDMKMHSRLKAKTDKTTTGSSHSVVKLKKLPDEKKIRDAKYIEKRCIFKKPQERVREEEEQILEEGVPQLPQDFRLSLQLKQKPKYLRFDIKQSSPGSGETQNKEQEVQPQTLPTETVLVTSPCPTMDPFQVEVKQSAERLTGRETTDPENPLTVLENSRVGEVLIETRECGIPFGGSPRKTMDDHIAEEKTDLKRVLSAIALGSFIIHMLPLSYFKRQKIRKKLSGAKRLLSPKSVIRKVKKSTNLLMLSINRHGTASLRKRLRANFKILIKQMLQDKIVVDVLVNVTYTHMFILSHSRTHSRLNAENCSQTELKQEKSKDEKEKKYSINKSSYSRYTLEEVELQDEVRGDEAPPEAVLHDSWNLRMDANPEKELKMEEVPQTITSRESLMESVSYTLDGTQNKGLQCSFKMKMKNVRDKKEEEGKHETLPAPENSQHFIFNAYQNCGFIKSDEELKETQSINIQVQPQTHDKQTILGSTSCPVLDQFQFGNLESYARFSPPKSGEGKIDEIIFSTREYSVPSDSNHQKEQAGGTEKKDTVTFNFCIPALSTLKRKRNFKKYSDTKTLVNLKCGILKAKKPPVSYIFSIKGGVSPNHRKELGCNSTTKMVEVDQSEKMEAKTYSSVTITTPNLNMYSKIEREKGMLGETSLSSKQVKQAIPPNEGKIISDDTKKNSFQDEEKVKKKQETLKVIPQHSQHFKFHSGQRKELDLHQSEGQGSVIEQDISHRMQPTDSMQGEKPKKSHQTQNGAIYTASSKLPLLKSKESLIGEILMDTMMVSVLTVGSHKGKLYSHGKEENAGLKNLQATVLESLDLGKSPGDGEVWKADSIDTQNRSSNTIKRNVQHKKEEENIQKMLSESVPDYNQHFSFSAYHMKNPGSYQSESELNNSEVRNSWNLSYTAQKMRQEKCFRETILEPVSRHVMNFLQVETVKSHHAQEEIKCIEGVKTPFPKVRKSKTGSIQCGARWDRNPRRKWDSSIFERKTWNQNDLVRTVLKPSNFSSFDSSEPKNQRYTLEFEGNKTIINPKYVTLKAKKQPVLQLLDITRCFTGSHRKTMGCKFQYKMKKRQWFESVSEASLLAEGTEIPPPKLVTDKHSFSATARDTLYNRPLHRNLHGHITKEKAELRENSATTFQGPLDFFMPILSDSESQINTVQLLEEKITLNLKCLTMKERDPVNSQMLKIRGRFTTKRRKKLGSNLKARMQQMSQSKNVADTFPNTGYFTPDTSDIKRQSRLKIGMDRVSRFSGVQPTQMELPVEGLEKKIERKREKTVLNVDLKFMYDSMPILSHTKMEESPGTWGIYEESSEKRNTLSKANASSAYACTPMHPKIIKHKAKVKTADVENTLHTSRVTLKAKRPPVSKLFDSVTTRYGTRRNKMELRCYIKAQKEFQQYKTVTDLFLNTIYGSGFVSSQIKQFTEVKGEKDRSGKPMYITPQLELEKSLNKRKISSSGSTDIKSAISRNIKILKQCIREEKENCQTVLQDILPQCRDQLAITQQVKKELDHVKIGVALKREVYPDLASPKREISYTRFNIPRIRTHTDCEFFVAQRVKHKDADIVKHSVSIPWERGVSEKTNVSLISKGHNIYLTELDAFRQRTHKEQELWKRESISRTIRGSIVYPIMEPSHLKMTGKVAEEDMYINKKNISHLLRREDIEETNILQGSKGHKFLCTNLVVQQNMSAVQKGEAKPDDIPESIVDSVSHPNREHLQVTQPVHTKKEDVSIPMRLPVNPWRKEQSKLTDIPLRLNRPKIIFPEKLRVKQPHSSTQDKGDILESISSCILHQFHNEKLKEKVSMERMSSKVLSSVVDKASNEADTLGDPPYINLYNRKRKEHQKESTCKVLPMSVSHSSMDVLQIKLPCVKKILKPPAYHTSNTKGIGLLVEEKEHPECIHQISPKSAPHSLRDVFQSKIPREKKASEVVSIVDYVPSTEKIGPPITGKESKVQTGKGKSGMKLTSLCTSLPSLSHTNMNSRAKVGQDKSGILKSCLLPLTLQVSPNVRKISFAESINRDSLSNIQESEHLPQEKKDGENVVHVKDRMGLQRVTFKGQKTAFKHTLHGNEPQWNNKEQEKMRQKDSDLDIVKNKHYASIPSPPHVEWDPEIKEVLMRGITGFCLPSLTLQELSNAMGICEEPTDDILSSIKKAKYMPQKGRVEVALEEIRHPKIIVLKAKQTPVAQELQLNIKEKEKKLQENKDKQVGMWSESSVSISFPPYSEVDTRVKGEEAMLIKTRSSFLQTKFQESSDTGKIAYRQSINGDASTSIKKSKEYIIQEEEERVKMVQVVPLRKKKSPILQETQLDSKEQEKKIQKMKGESSIFVTNTSTCTLAPFYVQLDTRIKKADYVTEVTRYSLPELSQQKSSDAMKKASKESTDGDIRSDVQEAKEYALQKEETNVEKSAKRDMMQPKDEDLERKQAVLQDIPLNLKEQVIVDPKGEDQGKMDGGGKGKQEVVLSSNWASESSLTYHELNTSIEGEEDIQGITKSAVSLLQLQKLVDARKIVYTKSAGDDTPNDVRGVQEYEPQREEDRRKTINMKYIMYPQSTKAKALPLPHVLYTSRSCDPQIREVQMSIKEKVRYTQERSELGKILTRPSLSQVKLNKGIEGKEEKRVTGPFLPPSWHRESSNAEKLRYTVPLLDGISNYSKRTKCMTQREEDKANNFEKDIIHPKYIGLKAKKSPLLLILKTKKLQVNMKEQEKVGQEDSKETIVLLSKIHPCVTSTHLKWNAIKDKEGEPGIIRNDAPYIEPQESLPSMEIASTEVPDSYVKKGEQRPQQEERNRVQTEASSRLLRDTDLKAKTSSPPHTCSVTEHGDLNKRKEPQWSMKEEEEEQQRTEDPDVALTKTPPSTPSPSYHRLDTRTKVDKDLLAVTGFSPSQLLCPKSSGAGKIRYADSNKGISSCNVIIKAYQCMPYTKVKDRKKIKYGEGIIFPQIITLPAETSPLPHLPSRKRLPLNIKEQGKGVPKGKSELKETYACLPSSSYLKWDTRMYEREDTLRMTQSCFPPPKIQDPSNSGKKTYTKSFDGYVLKEKGRLKTDTENKMARIHMALKAKELPLSLMLNTKKLQWKIREQERKVQKEKNDTATNLENICTSLFTLPHLKFSSTEGERYMIRITKMPLPQLQSKESPDAVKTTYVETTDTELSNGVKQLKEHTLQEEPKDREKNMDVNSLVDPTDRYLKAKKLPNLLRYNLNDLQWKTKEQEGTAQEVQHKPCGAMLTKTCICRSPLLHFSTNTRDKEKRMPILARSSLSSVSFQESSDSEDMEYIEPIASDILIIPQKGKYHMPQNKEENGVEIVNLMLPKHQEKKMQESEDESDVVVAKSSSPLPSLPRLQLDKEIQVDDEILGPTRSIVQRVSNVGEIVHTEAINDHVMKDSENRKQHGPQEEEQDREKTIDRNMMHTTDISLKSRKSPPSLMLYRTELHLNIVGQEQKKHECPGKPLGTVLRKLYVSKPPAKLTLEKGTQVNEERLRIKRPSRLPQIFSAVSDTGKRADTEAICDLREKKQHMSQKEKKHEVKTVDMRIRMDHKEARISSISHIFDTKEFVLNIKELKENMYKGKDVVLTRTFLSAPSAPPLYLDSRSKRDKDISGVTGSSPPQQNFQESSDTQKMSITEVVAGNSEIIVKKSEHSVPQEETVQQWTSNFMISVQRRNEPPRVKSEGDLSQLVLNSQPEDVYLTGFGTIRGKRLEYFFTGQEVQPDKYKTETFTTFLSYPTMDPAKIKNLKKQTEIMDSLNHKMSPKVLVSPPQKISKEIYVTFGPPASTNGFSVSEQGAHQQKTLSKASPGSADSYKFDKPEGDVHDKDKMSKIPSPKVLAPQTKGSLEKMNITGSDTAPIIEEQEIVMKKQVVLQSESGQKTWLDSSFSLKFPLQNERQKTPLEIDVHKQSTVYPRIQILPGIHMDITVFDTIGGEKKQTLPVPEQEECILESLQKSLSSHWTFPLQSGGLEGKNKTDTSTTINLEQKTLEMEEGELKIDRNIAICLGEDKTEMHKHTMVNLEENKKRDTSNTIDMNIPSLKAQKSQINTQMMTHTASSYPIKQKHKKKLEVSGAKQNIQPQKLFQKHVLDSFYAYIPLSLKLEGWKGRLTVTDLKRELSPKYLTMKIPNHPISQILNNTGRGTPSNRKKLEYDFKKPKKTILCSKDASGTFIRNLSISTMSSSQTEEIADFETNLEREKISCLSEFQKKSPNSKKKSSSAVKEGNQNFINTVPPDSQPFLVLDKQQMQKLPSVKSEANLSCETNEKILIPQTKEERVVPGHASSSIIKEPDLLMTEEEEKAPKPILTPTEYPLMSDYPKDNCTSSPDQGEKSEPIQDTTTQKVQQQKTFLGTVPIPSQVKSNEIKVVAHSTSAESSLPLCEATKNIFESQIKNIIHDKICEDILKKVKDHKPNDWKSLPCAGSPETTSTMIPPKMQSKPILERFTPKENGRLTNHLESKAFEIKLNLIPEMAKHSFQRFDFYLKQSISEDNSWRPYPRHKKVCFLSLEGIDTIELNFKQKYAKDSPPVSSLKTLIVNVSSDSEEIITKLKSTGKLEERGVSSVTSAKQMLLPHVLQNYSVEEKDKLLIHFSMKTLEIRMKAFPRIVRESYAMSNPQNIRKPLSKCIHSGIKVPKRKNRVLLIFEEKSLHQIDLDLQYKYLRFLLGLPVKSIFPKPTALPKHILKLNTVAICENIDYRGENSDDLCIDMELLEQHISFKKESPHENSSLMRKFLEPIQVCASDPDQQGTGQKDTTALSELKSHVTPGKDKQCHVWFQETDADKAFDSKAQESAPSLVDSHSTQLSEDFTGSQTNIESSANMEECSAPEAQESEECLFLEANPYLSQESQNILFELQKGIPLGNLYKMEKSKTVLKPLYREDSGSHHTRGCRKHSSIVTPSYESHKGRKYSSSSKMPSPDWLYHSSLNAVEVPSRSSSIPSGEGKTSWTARYRTSHSLAPLTESNVKLHLAKRQGKSHRHLESKERKKAKSDLCRKNNIHWDCDYSYTQNKEKCTRKKKVCHYESERSSYFPGRLELSKPYQEDISFHFERKQNQPFFYACIPADSLEIIPQTVRWTIPPRTLRKTNFRVPLVAKISSSFDIWTSSKKFLESLLGSFSPVNSN
ncbi:coiled-coil domain-containing protein 168 isoform X5 [Canis lupus familiaris]|uniref:coiled-coil domain-containing protein 168 isoform X5 n=1 Tax=Canis lupus familiaris TaxID=9615 RepID=UPI0018F38D4D|nr:coiled-coil domain-containing protein 168 isoform X5 [Canis lupus familiaris]